MIRCSLVNPLVYANHVLLLHIFALCSSIFKAFTLLAYHLYHIFIMLDSVPWAASKKIIYKIYSKSGCHDKAIQQIRVTHSYFSWTTHLTCSPIVKKRVHTIVNFWKKEEDSFPLQRPHKFYTKLKRWFLLFLMKSHLKVPTTTRCFENQGLLLFIKLLLDTKEEPCSI